VNTKKLPAILEEIIAGLEVVEVIPPTLEAKENQHVVDDVLPEELQRLASLWQKSGKDLKELAEKSQAEVDAIDSRAAQEKEAARLNQLLAAEKIKYEHIRKLLWDSVRLAFPELLEKDTIGLAKDFRAYWEEKDENEECELCGLWHGSGGGILGARVVGPIHLPGLSALLDAIFTQAPGEQQEPGDDEEEQPPSDDEPKPEGEVSTDGPAEGEVGKDS